MPLRCAFRGTSPQTQLGLGPSNRYLGREELGTWFSRKCLSRGCCCLRGGTAQRRDRTSVGSRAPTLRPLLFHHLTVIL